MNEIPLGGLHYNDFTELVARKELRPERPDDEDAPNLSDAIWGLAEQCWVHVPKKRPTADRVCSIISHLLEAETVTVV